MTRALLALVAASFPGAQPDEHAPQRLVGRALGDTPLLSDLSELCDGIGGRPTGSPACDRAIEWAARKFREAGADRVSLEELQVPNLWLGISAEASAIAPETFPLRIAAAPFSALSNGPIEGALIDAGEATKQSLDKLGLKMKDAILLIRSREMKSFDDCRELGIDQLHKVKKSLAPSSIRPSLSPRSKASSKYLHN